MDSTEQIKTLAARPQGVRSNDPDLIGTRGAIGKRLEALQKEGVIFRAHIHRREIRYFADQGSAISAENASQPRFVQRVVVPKQNTHFAKDATTVVPAGVKVQQCPGWTPRFAGHTVNLAIQRGRVTQENPDD